MAGTPAAAPRTDTARPLETVTLTRDPVLRVGRWNGDSYTLDDLHELVEAFDEGNAGIDPPVKLGHDKQQKLLQADGLPAAGYVARLYVEGDEKTGTLYADYRDVPKRLAALIKAKAYSKRSAEVYFNLKHGKKTYPRVLKAVAWLGADIPAVTGLADIEALYGMDRAAVEAHYTIADPPEGDVHVYELPADMSYGELRDALSTAIRARYPSANGYAPWVNEVFEDRFIFCDPQDKYWQLDYTVADDGAITLGLTPTPVRRVTSWRPITPAADAGSGVVESGAEAAYADDGDGAGDDDYAGQLDTFMRRLEERMKGAKGMSALRLFMKEARGRLATMKPRRSGTYSDDGAPAPEEDAMNEALLKALGLPADADEAAVTAKVQELTKQAADASRLSAERESQYSRLETEHKELVTKVAELTKREAEREATLAVDAAIQAGKVVPAMREVMLSQALRDPEWFKGYVEAAPVLAIFGEKGSAGEPKRDVQLSDADRELAAKLGVSEERYLASKQAIEQQRALVRG